MDSAEKKLNVLCLSYSRQVSRSHTIFSSWIEILIGVTIGVFGIVFAYSSVFELKPDIYKLLLVGESSFIIAGIISVTVWINIYMTRAERKDIVKKIKAIRNS